MIYGWIGSWLLIIALLWTFGAKNVKSSTRYILLSEKRLKGGPLARSKVAGALKTAGLILRGLFLFFCFSF